jgi:hypothetical protein
MLLKSNNKFNHTNIFGVIKNNGLLFVKDNKNKLPNLNLEIYVFTNTKSLNIYNIIEDKKQK